MIINILFILILPFLFTGWINRVKATWSGRQGAPLLQPWYDIRKLLLKREVISRTTTFIFDLAPALSLACILCAALFVPFGYWHSVLSFKGDFLLFIYLLAMSRFFSALAALDTGSSFEGMGTSRELSYTPFLEPALLITIGSVMYEWGYTSLSSLMAYHSINLLSSWSVIINVLTVLNLFLILIVEGCRVPFDDPTTHLELTMIHEVMVLDTSGTNLAYMLYGNWLKMMIYASLIASFVLPWKAGNWLMTALYVVIVGVLSTAVGLIESFLPRFRMTRNLELVLLPLSLALLTLCAVIVHNVGGV